MRGGFLSKPPETINAENAMNKANAVLEEGKALRTAGKDAEALAKFESVLPTVRKHGSEGAQAIYLEQVGMAALNAAAAGSEKLYVRAQEALAETVKLLDVLGIGENPETARVLQNLGIAYIQGGVGSKAVQPLERALTVLERAKVTAGTKEYANIVSLLNVARADKAREYDSD
jgi:tetratricopeptide (TPR) repeat protein